MKYITGHSRTHVKHVELHRSLLVRTASKREESVPSIFLGAGGSLWAGFPSTFNSILFHEGGLQVLITPSPLSHLVSPWGSVASDRPPWSGGNVAAHIAGQEFAIRVCRARLRFRSRSSNCQADCTWDLEILVTVIIRDNQRRPSIKSNTLKCDRTQKVSRRVYVIHVATWIIGSRRISVLWDTWILESTSRLFISWTPMRIMTHFFNFWVISILCWRVSTSVKIDY